MLFINKRQFSQNNQQGIKSKKSKVGSENEINEHDRSNYGFAQKQTTNVSTDSDSMPPIKDPINSIESLTIRAKKGDAKAQFHLGFAYYTGKRITQNYQQAAHWYKLAAEKGHALAQFHLGILYVDGTGVAQSDTKAFKYFQLAANQNLALAQFNLGCFYSTGKGTEQNDSAAFYWYELAADQGLITAQLLLGCSYFNGKGIVQNYKKALHWYQLAANQGVVEAQKYFESFYTLDQNKDIDLQNIDPRYAQALQTFNVEAENGVVKARKYFESFKYLESLDTLQQNSYRDLQNQQKKDRPQTPTIFLSDSRDGFRLAYATSQNHAPGNNKSPAVSSHSVSMRQNTAPIDDIESLKTRAEEGDVEAQFDLGLSCYLGEGIEQNSKEAVQWYELAAEQKHAKAQFQLGFCYLNGNGVTQSDAESLKWFRLAFDQGLTQARDYLNSIYTRQQNRDREIVSVAVHENESAAASPNSVSMTPNTDLINRISSLTTRAEKGDVEAQFDLGVLFLDGIEVTQHNKQAFKYFQLAAKKGNAKAQFTLGILYLSGTGIAPNDKKAFEYFQLAADQGHSMAQNNLGFFYDQGRGVAQSFTEAHRWYQLAAKQGNAKALFNLGFCYEQGRGTTPSHTQALYWYQLAANRGDAQAQNYLSAHNAWPVHEAPEEPQSDRAIVSAAHILNSFKF